MSLSSRVLPAAALACVAAGSMFALALLGLALTREGGSVAAVWLANGALVAFLLRQRRERWPALLGAALAGNLAAGLVQGDAPALVLALSVCNAIEILLVALPFSRRFGPGSALDTLDLLGRLAALAVLGPLVSTPLAAVSLVLAGQSVTADPLAHWFAADMLGILILTPLLLTLFGPRPAAEPGGGGEFAFFLGLALAAGLWVFSQETSWLFLLTPVLVLAGLRLRLDRAAVLVALVCTVGLVMTLLGFGPLNRGGLGPSTQAFLLQAFMVTVVTLVLPVAALSQERRRAGAALRRSEEEYRLLADNGSDLVLRLDAGGEALFVSSASRRLLGLAESALRGVALRRRIHPEDLPRFDASLDRSSRLGEAVTCFRMRHARGHYRWVEAHCRLAGVATSCGIGPGHESCAAAAEGRCLPGAKAPCPARPAIAPTKMAEPEAGSDVSIVATLRDIDQRRKAELLAAQSAARLRESNRLLLMAEELASLGHWVYDPQNRDVLLSAEAATLLDLPQLTMSPREALDLVVAEDRHGLLRQLALARRYDAPAACVVRLDRAGDLRTLQLKIQQTGADDGDLALFGVISDITEKLRSEQLLVSALEEARSAARFRSQFLATMSHEIRTPMTGVIGMIELLGADPAPAERRLYVETLQQSADLLMAVLNDILDFSKVDAGHLTFADEPFDVGQMVRTTLRLFERSASARGLRLILDAPPPGALWVRGDALRLQQVLSNLLSNAIKFSEGGDVSLHCSARCRAGGRRALRFTVEDQGIGIPASVQAQLFEPFVQGDGPAGRGGTGLGLAISRRLVAGMGGTIAVRSAEGRGSTFAVALELAEADAPIATADSGSQVMGRPLDLLLAEDNAVNQLLVTALLKRMGHRVTCAADGEAALACAAERRFDLILMDMQMPRRDGLSAATAIRSGNGPNRATPILALTADAGLERRPRYDGAMIDAVLTKPIDGGSLRAALASWTGPRQASAAACPAAGTLDCLDEAVLAEVRSVIGEAALDRLLDLLAAELEARPRAVRDALADQDLERAAGEVHSLKGAAANLGALRVAEAARQLEQAIGAAREGDRSALAPSLRGLSGAVSDTQHALAVLPRRRLPVALEA